jgi:acyl-CoA dehydrogenase
MWTSKALESEVVLLLARTGPGEGLRGLSLFLADLDPDYVDIRPIPKMGRNAVASCETFYDDLPVPGYRLHRRGGRRLEVPAARAQPERVLIAAEAIGIGDASLRRAVSYARDREVFGRPIGANQAISHPLALAHMQLEAAWQMTRMAAWRYDTAGLRRGGQHGQVPRGRGGLLRCRPRRADPRRHGIRHRIPRRALLP